MQQVVLRDVINKLHGTYSIQVFLNHLSPFDGSLVALLMNSSVNYNCMSPS
jgi:hypothetical protein